MKEILQNMALILLSDFCRKQNLICSGSHVAKLGRGFTYALLDNDTGVAFVSVTFHKSQVPTYWISND